VNVLVTVGSLPYQFDRVVRAVDEWAARHPEHRVSMQIGYSAYRPAHTQEFFDFAPFEHFQSLFAVADVAVSHGSAGPILEARRRGIPIVLVPRQARHGECYNDHQVEICEAIRGESAMRERVLDIADLGPALDRAVEKRRAGAAYEPHLLKQRLVATIAAFVESAGRDQ
jgi:UDP-N-acetylglucosamine transferase subunit ALG13